MVGEGVLHECLLPPGLYASNQRIEKHLAIVQILHLALSRVAPDIPQLLSYAEGTGAGNDQQRDFWFG